MTSPFTRLLCLSSMPPDWILKEITNSEVWSNGDLAATCGLCHICGSERKCNHHVTVFISSHLLYADVFVVVLHSGQMLLEMNKRDAYITYSSLWFLQLFHWRKQTTEQSVSFIKGPSHWVLVGDFGFTPPCHGFSKSAFCGHDSH